MWSKTSGQVNAWRDLYVAFEQPTSDPKSNALTTTPPHCNGPGGVREGVSRLVPRVPRESIVNENPGT